MEEREAEAEDKKCKLLSTQSRENWALKLIHLFTHLFAIPQSRELILIYLTSSPSTSAAMDHLGFLYVLLVLLEHSP